MWFPSMRTLKATLISLMAMSLLREAADIVPKKDVHILSEGEWDHVFVSQGNTVVTNQDTSMEGDDGILKDMKVGDDAHFDSQDDRRVSKEDPGFVLVSKNETDFIEAGANNVSTVENGHPCLLSREVSDFVFVSKEAADIIPKERDHVASQDHVGVVEEDVVNEDAVKEQVVKEDTGVVSTKDATANEHVHVAPP